MDSQALGPGPRIPEITDDNLQEAGPRVRALVMSRLEKMWTHVDRHMDEAEEGLRALDPRMLEIGRGLVKETIALYRLLAKPVAAEIDDEDPMPLVDRRDVVEARLVEIESKLKARDAAESGAQKPAA